MDIEITTTPIKKDLDAIRNGIHSYNKQYIGEVATKKDFAFSVLAKDKKKTLVGGINTVAFWGWLHIERLWIEEKSRGTGLGKQLLLKAEEFAIKKGVFKSRLETTGFQAKGFYLKQGYKVYGVLEDFPKGFSLYYLKKTLS
ncbi:MAG: GNAT family N-acetyltransferase [Desulfobacteraceae bacterium]|nr:GNAT family N-acetyltransferase [Desulfobacteraceae bacterium]